MLPSVKDLMSLKASRQAPSRYASLIGLISLGAFGGAHLVKKRGINTVLKGQHRIS